MSTLILPNQTDAVDQASVKIDQVRSVLAQVLTGHHDACLTCSFQAEDVLLTKLAIEFDKRIPILFLDTGYHFAETYEYRDRMSREWGLNLINLLPEKTVAEQEAEHGLLYQTAPDQCCKLRKVEPLFKAVGEYRIWLTGLRREQAKSRAALEESALFTLPGGRQVQKLAPLAAWSTRDVWQACERLEIPLLPLYERGYSSIGCEPCTTLPLDPNDPRSGRWAGRKVECGIHIEAAPAK
ncbi:Phosphoadenylyl-sulfate reductase [thioredoxin] [Acidisarcina polymorpha]|uniref:Adenosine 5'-phosphosulfate reductase n=1 Tax=Acidisarcina polymorpha TaxID=2211140 RepID=A0A2Z5G6J2_9BACT|nr:phosphoadenylyl-sulfate reductase [Acidisarcina polymorpha]AXC14255.1 Phosphoadenylyl-sulfate reductase [thioredoxin] [Acidisarcina polymorpha]